MGVINTDSGNPDYTVVYLLAAGFIIGLFFLYILKLFIKQVFGKKSKSSIKPVEVSTLKSKLVEIKEMGFPMTLIEEKNDRFILSCNFNDKEYRKLLMENEIKKVFSLIVTFNLEKNIVYLKDNMVSLEYMLGEFSAEYISKSGYIEALMYSVDLNGNAFSFRTGDYRKAAMRICNENGWDVEVDILSP